jgi:deferrochelatase/peroxidase EfeB
MNLKAEDPAALGQHVWVPPGADPKGDWLAGGSYLVARRINMTIEIWDRQSLREQERIIGRTKAEGAPLSGGGEFDQPDFTMQGRGEEPLVAADAHVRMVHPDTTAAYGCFVGATTSWTAATAGAVGRRLVLPGLHP